MVNPLFCSIPTKTIIEPHSESNYQVNTYSFDCLDETYREDEAHSSMDDICNVFSYGFVM